MTQRMKTALAILVVVILSIALRPEPADPESLGLSGTGPNGLGALAELIDGFGSEVTEGPRFAGAEQPQDRRTDVLFVPGHVFLGGAQGEEIEDFLRVGGRVIAAGRIPRIAIEQGRSGFAFGGREVDSDCADPALARVGKIRVRTLVLIAEPGDVACYGGDVTTDGAETGYALVRQVGPGEIAFLAADDQLRNSELDELDHAGFALALLAPQRGTRVHVLTGRIDLQRDPVALVSTRLWTGLWWLVIAFFVLAFSRGRRLGRPVTERVPVVVEGADLVLAVGNLMQRQGSVQAAADALRADLRHDLSRRLGIGVEMDPAQAGTLVRPYADHLPEGTLRTALAPDPVGDAATLVDVARAVHAVRAAVGAPTGPTAPSGTAASTS